MLPGLAPLAYFSIASERVEAPRQQHVGRWVGEKAFRESLAGRGRGECTGVAIGVAIGKVMEGAPGVATRVGTKRKETFQT